jgi:hypothetical protein
MNHITSSLLSFEKHTYKIELVNTDCLHCKKINVAFGI